MASDVKSIFQALHAVMAQVGAVKKADRNTQSNYNFRGIDAVTNAVYPAFVEHGVFCTPKVLDYQYGTVTVGQRRTEMGHARLLVEFTFYGPGGDSVTAVTAGEAFDSGDKATAKAHSVALRTALLETLMLPTDEVDPDTHTYERAAARSPEQEALAALQEFCDANGLDTRAVAKRFYDTAGADINRADAASITAFTQLLRDEVEAAQEPPAKDADDNG